MAAAIEASTDSAGQADGVILTVASYGRRLPQPAQLRYAELAALDIERADLGPAAWAQRRIQVGIKLSGLGDLETAATAVSVRPAP